MHRTLVPFFTEAALLPSFATNAERWTAGVHRSSQGREALHRGRMATMDAPVMRLFLAHAPKRAFHLEHKASPRSNVAVLLTRGAGHNQLNRPRSHAASASSRLSATRRSAPAKPPRALRVHRHSSQPVLRRRRQGRPGSVSSWSSYASPALDGGMRCALRQCPRRPLIAATPLRGPRGG
jgi:hypothetical protein